MSAKGEAPLLTLEIRRGKTKHPKRPVLTNNFLIGRSKECDLRLGGEEIPEAYAAILVSPQQVRIQWFGEGPALLVNGSNVQEAGLKNGDVLTLGRFEFFVADIRDHQSNVQRAEESCLTTGDLRGLLAQAKSDHPESDFSDQSVENLVDHLEAEQTQLEAFQAALKLGEEALLFAAAQRTADLTQEPTEENAGPVLESPTSAAPPEMDAETADAVLDELERVVHQLSGFSSELDERAARLADQELTQAESAQQLLEAQKQLAEQLERFQERIRESEAHDQTLPPQWRKAA